MKLKATEMDRKRVPNSRQQRQRIIISQQMYGFDIPLKALPLEKKSQTKQTSQKNSAEQKTTQHRSNNFQQQEDSRAENDCACVW